MNGDRATPEGLRQAWDTLAAVLQAPQAEPRRDVAGQVPLTIVAGFLGAGKTTLVGRLLAGPAGRRIAVLVNDFGRLDIDADLIRSRSTEAISLANGCICCTLAGDLSRTLRWLTERPDPPDAVVIEASGLADPRPVALAALADPALRLDGLLTLVDAETIEARRDDPTSRGLFLAQIAAADLLLLTKTDLVAPPARAAAHAWLAGAAPGRPVLDAVHAELPTEILLGHHATRPISRFAADAAGHAAGFSTWSLAADHPLDRAGLRSLLDTLPASLLRAKGILCLADSPAVRTIYQRVGPRWSFRADAPWIAAPQSRLVLIGPAGCLDGAELADRFSACQVGQPATG